MFEEVDNIIRLGKWAYNKIPVYGNRCADCFLLEHNDAGSPYCELRPAFGLIHDNDGAFKSVDCPRSVEES